MRDLGIEGQTGAVFMTNQGLTTQAAIAAAAATARATEQANDAANLNPTALGSAPAPTFNPMRL